jgi:hypothetical protein
MPMVSTAQISMNVIIAMVTVSKAVLTLKEGIFVLVLMDIFSSMQPTAESVWMEM